MNLPPHIDVIAHRYTITDNAKEFEKWIKENGDPGVRGFCCHASQKIIIDPRAPLSLKRDILLHEIHHAVWVACGMAINDMTGLDHETIVSRETPILLDVLRRNPDVTQYLLDDAY